MAKLAILAIMATSQNSVATSNRRYSVSESTFRSRRSGVADMPRYAATEAKNNFGKMLQTAFRQGAVAITRRNEPEAVLLSMDEYRALVAAGSHDLDALSAEFDAMLKQQQTPKAKRGAKTAFNASPTALGKAAVAHARKHG